MRFEQLSSLVRSLNGPRVCADSRLIQPGDVFVAVRGSTCDGHNFIEQALAKGARYIVCERLLNLEQQQIVQVADSAKAAAELAQASQGFPAKKLINLAVTGTNGKTTVAFLVRSVIRNAAGNCGLIGTIFYDAGTESRQAKLTTPDCFDIARMQRQMLQTNTEYMVIAVSSHALSQQRLTGIDFKAAAFTNLSGDHLDYHRTENDYLSAKSKLFENLSPQSFAVLNADSGSARRIAEKTRAKLLWFSLDKSAGLSAEPVSMDSAGSVFSLNFHGKRQKVHTPLVGKFNVSNHLAAAGICLAAGFDLPTIARGLSELKTIPGRMEKLQAGRITVFIDYAHTDDALKNVLSTLKTLCKGKLLVVFGCGGDRDRSKRPRMARVAEQFADMVVITTDNPRTENPPDIISDIAGGLENPGAGSIFIEQDRRKAIELAIQHANPSDIVLIAGKGHETYQLVGSEKYDFSDKQVALESLKVKNAACKG